MYNRYQSWRGSYQGSDANGDGDDDDVINDEAISKAEERVRKAFKMAARDAAARNRILEPVQNSLDLTKQSELKSCKADFSLQNKSNFSQTKCCPFSDHLNCMSIVPKFAMNNLMWGECAHQAKNIVSIGTKWGVICIEEG